jgi:hypothetical protein
MTPIVSVSKAYTYFWSSNKTLSTITVSGVTYACALSGLTREAVSEFNPSTTITFTASSSNSYKTYIEPVDTYGNPLHLENGAYEFKVTRISSYSSNGEDDALNQSKLHVRYLEEIETTNMNYGGVALLGIDIKATDQLNNSRPNFKMICTRKPLYILDKYVPSTNPAQLPFQELWPKEICRSYSGHSSSRDLGTNLITNSSWPVQSHTPLLGLFHELDSVSQSWTIYQDINSSYVH